MTIPLYTGVVPALTQTQPEFDVNTQDFIDYIAELAPELNDYAATLNNESTNSTSTSSVTIGTGNKSFTVETNKGYFTGMTLKAVVTADVTKSVTGSVVSYNTSTGALVLNVTSTSGSGTFSAWSISFTVSIGDTITANLIGNQSGGSVSATTGSFSGLVTFNGNVAPNFVIDNRSSADGGAFILEKASSSTLAGDVIIDTNQQFFRFFENGGTGRGAFLDLTTCSASAGSVLVTSTNISTYNIIRATAQNTTSGTSIDFTSIPSWVKRITVMFQGVSTNGTSKLQLQIGAGSLTTTGYLSSGQYGTNTANNTTGFLVDNFASANDIRHGAVVLTNITSNAWVISGTMALSSSAQVGLCGGSVSLSGTLDRLRLTTVNGTDTFDAGSVNIMYE